MPGSFPTWGASVDHNCRIEFKWSFWKEVRDEVAPLWEAHNQEIASPGDRKLYAPDWVRFDEMAAAGKDHWVAARLGEQLVGYVFCIVTEHLHRMNTLSGFWDLYYLKPEHRHGWNGYKLIRAGRDSLWTRGVRKQYIGTKMWKDIGPILERLGFSEAERLYTVSLDN